MRISPLVPSQIVFVLALGLVHNTGWAQNYRSEYDLSPAQIKEQTKRQAQERDPEYIAQKVNQERVNDFFKAVRIDNVMAVRDLLKLGFDPNRLEPHSGFPPLVLALYLENYAVAQALIEDKRTNVELENANGENALMMAALKGQTDLIRQLIIQRKAQVGKSGWTALHYAASTGQLEAMHLLIEEGAYLDAPAPNGNTPLMMSSIQGNVEAVKLLLDQGADPLVKNKEGLLASDWAQRGLHDRVLALLQKAQRDYQFILASQERARRAAALRAEIAEREQREAQERAQAAQELQAPQNSQPTLGSMVEQVPSLASVAEMPKNETAIQIALPRSSSAAIEASKPTEVTKSSGKLSTLRYSAPTPAQHSSTEQPLRYNPIPPPALIIRQ